MAATAAIVAAGATAASAGAGIANSMGGDNTDPRTAGGLSTQQMTDAGNQYLGGVQQTYGPASNFSNTFSPYVSNFAGNVANNPYAGQAQAGAGAASQYGTGTLVPQLQGASSGLSGLGTLAGSYAPQLLSQAFDPQRSLYDQQYQQMRDQQNVINSQNGVAGSPYAAGVVGRASQDFNNNWLNNQMAREISAANGANTLIGAAGRSYIDAANLGGTAMNTGAAASALPSNTYQGLNLSALQGLGQAGSAQQSVNAPFQSYLSNLSSLWGQSQPFQQSAFNQGQTIGQNGGQSLAALFGDGQGSLNSAWNTYNNRGIDPVTWGSGTDLSGLGYMQ